MLAICWPAAPADALASSLAQLVALGAILRSASNPSSTSAATQFLAVALQPYDLTGFALLPRRWDWDLGLVIDLRV